MKKNNWVLKVFSLVIIFYCISCTSKSSKEYEILEDEEDVAEMSIADKIENSNFREIVSHFNPIELPIVVNDLWNDNLDAFNFDHMTLAEMYSEHRFQIDTAIKYFFKGDSTMNNQPSGVYMNIFTGIIFKVKAIILFCLFKAF